MSWWGVIWAWAQTKSLQFWISLFSAIIAILSWIFGRGKAPATQGVPIMTEETKSVTGIKETMELVDLACDAIKAYETAMKDGKLDTSDLMPAIMTLWPDAIPAFTGIENVPKELAAMDATEAEQLVAHVATKLTFDNARATAIVEASLKLLTSLYQTFSSGKELLNAIHLPTA